MADKEQSEKKKEASRINAAKAREAKKLKKQQEEEQKKKEVSPETTEDEQDDDGDELAIIDNALSELRGALMEDFRSEMINTYKETIKPKMKKLIVKHETARKASKSKTPVPESKSKPKTTAQSTQPTGAQKFSSLLSQF
jgi:hypothetical protein